MHGLCFGKDNPIIKDSHFLKPRDRIQMRHVRVDNSMVPDSDTEFLICEKGNNNSTKKEMTNPDISLSSLLCVTKRVILDWKWALTSLTDRTRACRWEIIKAGCKSSTRKSGNIFGSCFMVHFFLKGRIRNGTSLMLRWLDSCVFIPKR